eukprot:TRINITY_DN20095_c0_g1_i1.p1 TRINITY_DN20095_c0_g1~~TRINITY_DN20095_c0_g1_i1.p1  ORF type:complete len:265 (-),score=6.02 TRINITY_DN20095_c0_g1_i1:44-754(-)
MTVEDTFCRNFTADRQIAGEGLGGSLSSISVELKPGGADIPLTRTNREEYVRLAVRYHLGQAVEPMMSALVNGFWKVCHKSRDLLQMCHPLELDELVCGIRCLEFDELRRHTKYRGGFSKDSTTIKHFWQVVDNFSNSQKEKLLTFCTGSHRVPTQGLKALRFTIVCVPLHEDDEDNEHPQRRRTRYTTEQLMKSARLPVAHTCFNQLDLPEYDDVDVLRNKLLTAIDHQHGFGLL